MGSALTSARSVYSLKTSAESSRMNARSARVAKRTRIGWGRIAPVRTTSYELAIGIGRAWLRVIWPDNGNFGSDDARFLGACAAEINDRKRESDMIGSRIGVVMGGSSGERDVSLRTGAAVAKALDSAGHDVVRLELGAMHEAPALFTSARIDVAFLALHGRYGEDGCVQGLLELLGIPYTGSGVLASALAMDKLKSKELFRLHNLPTPPYYVFGSGQSSADLEEVHGSFGYPVVVKPRREGSSLGVSKATNASELGRAIELGLEHDDCV